MFTKINEFRDHLTQVTQDILTQIDYDKIHNHDFKYMKQKTINKIINIALTFNLNREQTIKLIETIFTDSSQAPNAINVNFVKTHLKDIINQVNNLNNNKFKIYNYTNEMLTINISNDIALYVENIDELIKNINEKLILIILNVYMKTTYYI